MQTQEANAADSFSPYRGRLVRLAYRMVGTMADAEDIVQDAYLRWDRTDRSGTREPIAFLSRIVTRLCLDFLKSARVQREQYVGSWLPEPVLDWRDGADDGVTFALMLDMERLSPLERAAFLLHDVRKPLAGILPHVVNWPAGRETLFAIHARVFQSRKSRASLLWMHFSPRPAMAI